MVPDYLAVKMARVSRTRSRTSTFPASKVEYRYNPAYGGGLISTYNYTGPESSYEFTSDYHGSPLSDTPFLNQNGDISGGPFASGYHQLNGINRYVFYNVPIGTGLAVHLRKPWTIGTYQRTPISSSTLGAMAVGNMNPNRPRAIDLPTFIGELKDFPALYKGAIGVLKGFTSLKKLKAQLSPANWGKVSLMTQFGLLPLISDLEKMRKFTIEVAKQEAHLRKLNGKKHRMKRKLTTENWSGQTFWQQNVNGAIFQSPLVGSTYMWCSIWCSADRTYWFTAEASLSVLLSERELHPAALRSAFGLNTGAITSTAWELLPWSWMADWFTTTGMLINAYRSGIPWTWSRINVMHKTTYRMYCDIGNIGDTTTVISPNQAQSVARVKTRDQATGWALPEFKSFYIDAYRLGILSSLIAARL
jgi:hypothetical protein